MTFFYDLNRQLAAVEQADATKPSQLAEATDHMGDRQQTTYAGWKAACRKAHPDVWFDGDRDIASAMVGPKPFKRGETKSVGEWDGDKGSVYKSTAATVSEGYSTQQSHSEWKKAVRAAHPDAWFKGDDNVGYAMVGPKPFERNKTKEVGTWQAGSGSVHAAKSAAVSESVSMTAEERGYDSVGPEQAAEIVAHMDSNRPLSVMLDKYPELSRMMDIIAVDYQLHTLKDMEEIEDILYGSLAQIADQMYEASDEQSAAPMSERESADDRDRKFAALAEPYDEITYADKIAGAKQGDDKEPLDEVLPFLAGVAARGAVASALSSNSDEVGEGSDMVDFGDGMRPPTNAEAKRIIEMAKKAQITLEKLGVRQSGDVHWAGTNKDGKSVSGVIKKERMQGLREGRIDDLRDRQEAERRERGEEQSASKTKFVAGRAYGGARQEVDDEDDEDAPRTKAEPAAGDAPRKRGRPVGSKRAIGAKGPGFKSKLLKKGAIAEYSEVDEGAIDDLRDRLEAERRERGEEETKSKTKFVAGRAYGGARQEVDDEDDEDAPRTKAKPATDAPRKRGRPVGSKRAIGAKGPGFKSKLLKKGAIAETDIDPVDQGEYDQEGDMAHDQLSTAKDAAAELRSILTADENLPEWVQKKITMAVDYLDTARDYMKSQKDSAEPVAEKAVSKAQRTAAGIAYAAKKGDLPKSELKGASKEMAKMPAGELKKFAKTKEKGLPAKKTKEVEETTTSGSVATGAAAAPKSKGGMQFGKGIYDSLDRQLEQMIAEGMNVTATVSNQGGTPTKTVSVTADGDDADRLMELLSLSGVAGAAAEDEHSCPTCSQSPCGCASMVDENSPDWPTNTEVSNDALQYSGGLNRPKSTGQTTGAIPDISSDRRGQGYKGIAEGDSMAHRLYTELGKL